MIVIASGVGFVYEYRGAHEETARQEEKAKPTSDVFKTLWPPQTTSAPNAVAPTDNAAPAPEAAPDEPSAGNAANSAPVTISKTGAPEAPAASQQWMNVEDFLAEYRGQINSNYPDRAWGRCQDGVSQRAAHWSPRPAGQYFLMHGTNDRTFRKDAADLTAKGFKMQYDNVFPDCDGSTHHQTLWMKAG